MNQDRQYSSFDLHIVFGGMCLLARDEAKKTLHVLLPHMPADHPHDASLTYDQLYSESAPEALNLHEKLIEFPALGSTGDATLHSLDGVVDLTQTLNATVSRDTIEGRGEEASAIRARVTLPLGKAASRSFGGRWEFGASGEMYMATWVEWLVQDVQGGELVINATPLASGGTSETRVLRPADGRIEMLIFHARRGDIPARPRLPMPMPAGSPGTDHPIKHFHAFYDLVPGLQSRPTPKYRGRDAGAVTPAKNLGTDFTCVAATAVVRP